IHVLPPELAYSYSKKWASRLCSARDVNISAEELRIPTGPIHISNLDALLTDDSRQEVSRRAPTVATAIALAGNKAFAALSVLPPASEPLPCRLSTQDLVELLRMPTCFGEARKVVLKHLGNRYHRVFANHWEFVRYAKEQRLDLDFTTPPKRP